MSSIPKCKSEASLLKCTCIKKGEEDGLDVQPIITCQIILLISSMPHCSNNNEILLAFCIFILSMHADCSF